ncbi:hypothetical protein LTR05_000365 [Lithohypha guttulata]|uniref:Uncharacterized protein n=1 Tax=Lithohypha guttulata TaxID=1690604 RepID=A0AAN7Y922_9EURO|nr:hypothetical protein LTR05_000365 [Lithohypha guttulata]
MAQHTSRQRAHLLTCEQYLEAMKEAGIMNSITQQAADPASFFKNSKVLQAFGEPKPPKILKMGEISTAVRIQALALAEAHISLERIQEITGIDPKIVAGLRKLARERGYDPNVSMVLREDYVWDPPNSSRPRGRPKKRRGDDDLDPELQVVATTPTAPSSFGDGTPQLPPGNWNFMTPVTGYTVS